MVAAAQPPWEFGLGARVQPVQVSPPPGHKARPQIEHNTLREKGL